MKNAFVFSILLFMLTGFSVPESALIRGENDTVLVVFNSATTFEDLATIRSEMKSKGIVLSYLRIEFNEGGGLKEIKIKVDCKDGFSGTASSKILTPESQFGFKRDYSQNSEDPFTVGNLDN